MFAWSNRAVRVEELCHNVAYSRKALRKWSVFVLVCRPSACQKGHPGCFDYGFLKPLIVRKLCGGFPWCGTELKCHRRLSAGQKKSALVHLSGCLPSSTSSTWGCLVRQSLKWCFVTLSCYCSLTQTTFFGCELHRSKYSPLSFFATMYEVTVRTVGTFSEMIPAKNNFKRAMHSHIVSYPFQFNLSEPEHFFYM